MNGKQIGHVCGEDKPAALKRAAALFGEERQDAGMAALAALETEVLAHMVALEASRLHPIPTRRTYKASEETLPVFARIESALLFDRREPEQVPKAPYVSVFRGRLHTYLAIDGETDERVAASQNSADRTYLRCPLCRERLKREWDADLQRFFFDHRRGRCPMHQVS